MSVVDLLAGGTNLRLLWSPQLLPNPGATKLHAQGALELAEDLRTRDGPTRLVVLDDGRLLVHLLSQVLLG